jgi:hypothetical protein
MSAPIAMDPMARWGRAMAHLAEARRQEPLSRTAATLEARDQATEAYVTAAEALVAELGMLAATGILVEVDDFLQVIYGRVS